MATLWNRVGHYIFALWFLSSFFFYLFYSSPNLSSRILNVYHTSTHGVALVRIQNACLKPAARGWLKMKDAKNDAKNRHLGNIPQLCRVISSQLAHVSSFVIILWTVQVTTAQLLLRRATVWLRQTWAEIDMGRKVGAAAYISVGELGPHLIQRAWTETYLRTKWYPDPSNCLPATIHQRYRHTETVPQHRANRYL